MTWNNHLVFLSGSRCKTDTVCLILSCDFFSTDSDRKVMYSHISLLNDINFQHFYSNIDIPYITWHNQLCFFHIKANGFRECCQVLILSSSTILDLHQWDGQQLFTFLLSTNFLGIPIHFNLALSIIRMSNAYTISYLVAKWI